MKIDHLEILSAAADFRRLETRLVKSSLWRILNVSSPFVIDDLADDAILNFLSFGTGSHFLAAVPRALSGSSVGLIAVGFPAGADVKEDEVIRVLKVIASMIAQSMRVASTIDEQSRILAEEN